MRKFNGHKLKIKRLEKGYTQFELAKKVNEHNGCHIVDPGTISRWEVNPEAVPRITNLVKVAKILEIPVDFLFENKKNNRTKILSLNTNQFFGPYNLYETKKDDKYKDEVQEYYLSKIVDYIKVFLKENNEGVAILQEIPIKMVKDDNCTFYKEFEKYSIIKPVHLNDSALICTIAISNKEGGWETIDSSDSIFENMDNFRNRIVEIENGNLKILGVHIPGIGQEKNGEREKAIRELWDCLIKKAEVESENNTVIIGDLNAHNNNHRESKFRAELNKLEDKFKNLINHDTVTFYPRMTTIDHVLYSEQYSTDLKATVVPSNYSDHAIIISDAVLECGHN